MIWTGSALDQDIQHIEGLDLDQDIQDSAIALQQQVVMSIVGVSC